MIYSVKINSVTIFFYTIIKQLLMNNINKFLIQNSILEKLFEKFLEK